MNFYTFKFLNKAKNLGLLKNSKTIEHYFKRFVPSPFSIAVILTIVVMLWVSLSMTSGNVSQNFIKVLSYWENGIWNESLLVFAYQMMLILVLGHILVLSQPMQKLLDVLTAPINSSAKAVVIVSVSTMLMAFFNWGLGLIFGAILVRKIGESCAERGFKLNYPLLGASGYIGLMVWHGGLSGSAPLKVAESGHLASLSPFAVPDFLATAETILSFENLLIFGLLLLLMPLLFLVLHSRSKSVVDIDLSISKVNSTLNYQDIIKFEKIRWPATLFGGIVLLTFAIQYKEYFLDFRLTPNMLNFLMLGLAFILHGNFYQFLKALKISISDVSGILIQFPLYFGIMGVMKDSGLAINIAEFFVSISTTETLPIFTFMSAGLLNIFVPSGGGQWVIQGPIIIESSHQLQVPLPKMLMAMAYGDQITNMLQPFWALPLLAITKLKAYQILPFTFWMFLIGSLIFIFGLVFIF
ncbi:MAG: short-chain fatty acid transporter [Psychroflexus sp.]|nr:short-chain fatty acid transporter [Psychroflexus sp.]